jgi:hypothetical protein
MSRFQALRAQVEVRIGDAGDVAPGPGEALNQPQTGSPTTAARQHGAKKDSSPSAWPQSTLAVAVYRAVSQPWRHGSLAAFRR